MEISLKTFSRHAVEITLKPFPQHAVDLASIYKKKLKHSYTVQKIKNSLTPLPCALTYAFLPTNRKLGSMTTYTKI